MKGRLYWSDEQYQRDAAYNIAFRSRHGHTCIGRLEDGTEVEYNRLITREEEPEPGGDFQFLGIGEFVGICRVARPEEEEAPETVEIALLKSPYVPDSIKQDPLKLARISQLFHEFQRIPTDDKPILP